LEIYGLDLRHTPSVEIFAQYMQRRLPRLDILINNAAQTVRRPPGFYAHMLSDEMAPIDTFSDDVRHLLSGFEKCKQELGAIPGSGFKLSGDSKVDSAIETPEVDAAAMPISWVQQSPAMGLHSSALLSQIPYSYDRSLPVSQVFPSGKLDQDLQQVDLRETNSWRYKLTDVPAAEMLEVQLVNAIAPFVLNSQLVPIMRRDFTGKKHLVNVTAMEGKFYRFKKEDRHPHTNMAKAALNMLTHTTSADLEKDGIFTNAVDTGWVTDEDPVQLAELKQQRHDFQPPLDIVDGAARVCDPIFYCINTGHHWSGKFLKDYQPIEW
jgi:NAD(P)-dependent dehydrogenase (short-subunit alcohol dehydrogenase family)